MSELLGCSAIEFGIMKKEMITRPQIKEDMIEVSFIMNYKLIENI